MRVLVTWGTRLGGTEAIARIIREVLEQEGFEVVLARASELKEIRGYQAAIIGGAVHANRCHRDIRRIVARNVSELRCMPVWLFSSGPVEQPAERFAPPPPQVAALMTRLGARGHATFEGRSRPDVKSNPGSVAARRHVREWRDPEQIGGWALDLARQLRKAAPFIVRERPARAVGRMVAYGVAGWSCSAVILAGLLQVFPTSVSTVLRAVIAPMIFGIIAARYFRRPGAREPLPTAFVFVALVGALDVVVLGRFALGLDVLFSFAGLWLPLALILLSTWVTGVVMSTMSVAPRARRMTAA